MSRDALYLRHILDAIEKIERYTAVGYERFMAESHWQDSVIRQLEIVAKPSNESLTSFLLFEPKCPGAKSPECATF